MLGIALFCSVGAKAQTMPQVTLSGSPDAITPVIFTAGSSENVAYLYATDVAAFCGTELNLFLPEGVSIIKKANSTLTKDDEGENIHTVQYSNKGAEGWKLLIYSSELIKFNGNKGALAKLTFSVSASFVGGIAKFKDGMFTDPKTIPDDSEVTIYETSNPSFGNIKFDDANVKALCVANWDTNSDGELSYDEAKAVTDLQDAFSNNTTITSFNELQYFTGLAEICDSAFYSCRSLTSITIPNSVTTIGNYAFCDCVSLTSITIPKSVTTIGDFAFYCCTSLTSITIPNSVTTIGDDAFCTCASLTSITIPNSVTTIGDHAFAVCVSLANIYVEDGNTNYDSRMNCNAIIETATNTLIAGCKNTIIPNSVTAIGNSAFNSCVFLTSITIPKSVTSIGAGAFIRCKSLRDVYVEWNTPLSVNVLFYETPIDSATLHVPVGTKALYKAAEVWKDFGTIVDDVTSGNIEFADANVKALCVANWDTNSDGELSYDEAMAVTSLGEVFFANNNITSFNELQNFTGLSEIGDNAFSYCSSLTGITIPNSVTKIGDFAFSECSGLTNLTIPNSVTSIGSNTFWCCRGLMNMTIPNSVTEIGSYAFAGCSGLNSVTISNCVTAIGEHTFDGCSNLTNVTIPNSVTLIGEEAFSHCSSLTNIDIPNSVTGIGGYAFDYCSSLASVTIPNSVTWIGNEAFRYCDSLKHVYVDWDTPLGAFNHLLQASIFGRFYSIQDATLHVPVYTKRKYAAATVWEDFGRIISFNDVNMDGQLTVADVTGVKNFILDLNTSGLWAEAADVNEDSKYLVDDLKDEVDLVLMGLTLAKDENNAKGDMNWANIVFAKSDDGELVVCTNDVNRYVGIQFDLMLPDDVELINTRTGKGAAGYAVRSQKLDNGMTRVIAYAMNTNTINDTEVLRLKFRSTDGSKDKVCDVTLHEISLSTPNALAVGSRDIDATVTLNDATGINSIYGDSNADAIYNMQGQKLVKAQRGINLTNGKKFIKR